MKVNITSRGFTARENQIELIEKKFGKLDKFFGDDVVVNVTMRFDKKNQENMEAMINVKGMIFRSEYSDQDMDTCLEKVVEKLTKQITRYKKKIQKSHRHIREMNFEEIPESEETLPEDDALDPIKIKRFELTAMSADEAVLQMELLGHSFYLFMNDDTGRTGVVYRRDDGTYGLIDPQY